RKLTLEHLEDLIPPWDTLAVNLMVLLRLAVLLHRGRSPAALPPVRVAARGGRALALRVPSRWRREHPLTAADLALEIEYQRAQRRRLRVLPRGR
ncbi:MAG: exopolyphosphatase, partial [Steroidobacteraceae bacterium]